MAELRAHRDSDLELAARFDLDQGQVLEYWGGQILFAEARDAGLVARADGGWRVTVGGEPELGQHTVRASWFWDEFEAARQGHFEECYRATLLHLLQIIAFELAVWGLGRMFRPARMAGEGAGPGRRSLVELYRAARTRLRDAAGRARAAVADLLDKLPRRNGNIQVTVYGNGSQSVWEVSGTPPVGSEAGLRVEVMTAREAARLTDGLTAHPDGHSIMFNEVMGGRAAEEWRVVCNRHGFGLLRRSPEYGFRVYQGRYLKHVNINLQNLRRAGLDDLTAFRALNLD